MSVVNLEEKFGLLTEHWQPRVVAELNDYQFKIARVKGEFVWHDHADTDEAFFVLEGRLRIELPDGAVEIGPGELYVVPKILAVNCRMSSISASGAARGPPACPSRNYTRALPAEFCRISRRGVRRDGKGTGS
ncbi:cupin domain-containing protein [Candidatus Palauibacter sp.]|uniref:cupin domain-containing protein n=1 Tax=Candidatus Palauibacter sp. TaxID=3101350 RepID=UPI003B0217EB